MIRFRSGKPSLSVVVVVYDMARELPRTLRSLAPEYQQGIAADDYEVIVVDNGSPVPVDDAVLAAFPGRVRSVRVDPAPPSPAHAANVGAELAEGDFVGLLIDGARMASPGLLAHALLGAARRRPTGGRDAGLAPGDDRARGTRATRATTRPRRTVCSPTWTGSGTGTACSRSATLAESSSRGWFAPLGESNGLFMDTATWRELGGLDERFVLPGGGLAEPRLLPAGVRARRRRSSSCCSAKERSTRSTAAPRRRVASDGTTCTPSTSRCAAGSGRRPPTSVSISASSRPRRCRTSSTPRQRARQLRKEDG